jgi:hypothetical protein
LRLYDKDNVEMLTYWIETLWKVLTEGIYTQLLN